MELAVKVHCCDLGVYVQPLFGADNVHLDYRDQLSDAELSMFESR